MTYLVGIVECRDISKFSDTDTDAQHVQTCWKKAQKCRTLGPKKCTSEHVFFFFFVRYTPLNPKNLKMQLKMKSADIFFLRVIVWYTLHTKFSEKLVSRQMQMLAEIYDIWPTLRHVHNMSTTFPTKVDGGKKF